MLTVPDIGDLYTAGVHTVGSLCTGTGQLERALSLAGVATELAFVADPDPAATKLLAHHHPDVPNLGDITATDWTRVPSIDILTAGWPCQPWSLAGKRKGAADERAIWPAVAAAVRDLRPRYVFLENVPNVIAAGELARAAGDLASLGYVGSWRCVRASDVGAAHRRERAFILAWQAGDTPAGLGIPAAGPAGRGGAGAVLGALLPTPRASDTGTEGRRASEGFRPPLSEVVLPLFPTPRTSDTNGAGSHGDGGLDLRTAVTLLPTPVARDGKGSALASRQGGTGLPDVVQLLPTPRASDGEKGGPNQRGSKGDLMLPSAVMLLPTPTVTNANGNGYNNAGALLLPGVAQEVADTGRWGDFAPAIARWEAVMGRPAPDPTEPGKTGQRLSGRFTEWLMGHEDGWVTGVPGLTRNQILALCGNGVVALQGAHALRLLASADTRIGVPA